jgi:hypothetical protein
VRRGVLPALAVTAGVVSLLLLGVQWSARGQGAVTTDEVGDEVQIVPRGQLPIFARETDTGALYRFATARGEVLRHMPCTCGCAAIGHGSNRSCYIKAESDASVTYTSHAAT